MAPFYIMFSTLHVISQGAMFIIISLYIIILANHRFGRTYTAWSTCKSILCHEISFQKTVCGIDDSRKMADQERSYFYVVFTMILLRAWKIGNVNNLVVWAHMGIKSKVGA